MRRRRKRTVMMIMGRRRCFRRSLMRWRRGLAVRLALGIRGVIIFHRWPYPNKKRMITVQLRLKTPRKLPNSTWNSANTPNQKIQVRNAVTKYSALPPVNALPKMTARPEQIVPAASSDAIKPGASTVWNHCHSTQSGSWRRDSRVSAKKTQPKWGPIFWTEGLKRPWILTRNI